MKGVQVFSSKAYYTNTEEFEIRSFDLMSLILGALYWKKYNGKVELYTDSITYDFLESNNLCKYWNKIDYTILDTIDPSIDQSILTKYSNIYILDKVQIPFCIFNNSVQVIKKLKISGLIDIKFWCREKVDYPLYLDPNSYLDKKTLKKINLDWFNNSFNADVLVFNNEQFIKDYKKEVNKFLTVPNILNSNNYDYNSVKDLLFYQQLLAYTAYKKCYTSEAIVDGLYVRDAHRSAHYEKTTININNVIDNNTLNLEINAHNGNILSNTDDFLLVIQKYVHIFKQYFPTEYEEIKDVVSSCNNWYN